LDFSGGVNRRAALARDRRKELAFRSQTKSVSRI
jgi:hypothetical protein